MPHLQRSVTGHGDALDASISGRENVPAAFGCDEVYKIQIVVQFELHVGPFLAAWEVNLPAAAEADCEELRKGTTEVVPFPIRNFIGCSKNSLISPLRWRSS
jgi:hypothetical protein